MKDESNEILSGMLADWHKWSKCCCVGDAPRTSAMFHGVRSSRQWDSESDVLDGTLHNSQMEAFDFHVNELGAVDRTALAIQARNLVTGRNVWTSARLPDDVEQRAVILRDARNNLKKRLQAAGIL